MIKLTQRQVRRDPQALVQARHLPNPADDLNREIWLSGQPVYPRAIDTGLRESVLVSKPLGKPLRRH
jgi:hypothetical protein